MNTAIEVLDLLRTTKPMKLADLSNEHGVYALWNHAGDIRYIGCTYNPKEGFHKRINDRHVTGSEGFSHKFSHFYCTGRMWRYRVRGSTNSGSDPAVVEDAKIAKKLRSLFIRRYCKATTVTIQRELKEDDTAFKNRVLAIERDVHDLAPSAMRAWERSDCPVEHEPTELVDAILSEHPEWKLACERQASRCLRGLNPIVMNSDEMAALLEKLRCLQDDGLLEPDELNYLEQILIAI